MNQHAWFEKKKIVSVPQLGPLLPTDLQNTDLPSTHLGCLLLQRTVFFTLCCVLYGLGSVAFHRHNEKETNTSFAFMGYMALAAATHTLLAFLNLKNENNKYNIIHDIESQETTFENSTNNRYKQFAILFAAVLSPLDGLIDNFSPPNPCSRNALVSPCSILRDVPRTIFNRLTFKLYLTIGLALTESQKVSLPGGIPCIAKTSFHTGIDAEFTNGIGSKFTTKSCSKNTYLYPLGLTDLENKWSCDLSLENNTENSLYPSSIYFNCQDRSNSQNIAEISCFLNTTTPRITKISVQDFIFTEHLKPESIAELLSTLSHSQIVADSKEALTAYHYLVTQIQHKLFTTEKPFQNWFLSQDHDTKSQHLGLWAQRIFSNRRPERFFYHDLLSEANKLITQPLLENALLGNVVRTIVTSKLPSVLKYDEISGEIGFFGQKNNDKIYDAGTADVNYPQETARTVLHENMHLLQMISCNTRFDFLSYAETLLDTRKALKGHVPSNLKKLWTVVSGYHPNKYEVAAELATAFLLKGDGYHFNPRDMANHNDHIINKYLNHHPEIDRDLKKTLLAFQKAYQSFIEGMYEVEDAKNKNGFNLKQYNQIVDHHNGQSPSEIVRDSVI